MINGKFSSSNNASVSTLTSPSSSSRDDEVCYLQNPIHENINYSDWFITQARYVHCVSGVMKKQVNLLSCKTCHSLVIEYFLKDNDIKEVISTMDIFTTLSTEAVIRQNKCQMSFLDNFYWETFW